VIDVTNVVLREFVGDIVFGKFTEEFSPTL